MNKSTSLYRMYDAFGDLLYVGISQHWLTRFDTHAKDKPWIREVRSMELEWFDDRRDAAIEERIAIRYELPKYNKQSVVLNTEAWQHFQTILQTESIIDDFHKKLKQLTATNVMDFYIQLPSFRHLTYVQEWAFLNALEDLSMHEDEIIVECETCTAIADTWWILEGHGSICDLACGGN